MKLLVQNSKMKKSSLDNILVYNFGIPAFLSKTGLKTCPNAGLCATGCYAKSGTYLFSRVAKAYEERLEVTLSEKFIESVVNELKNIRVKNPEKKIYVRIHDSGDFYSKSYFNKWETIAKMFPEVTFYAYTKQVKMLSHIESQIKLIFSFGGLQDKMIDVETMRHAKVFETEKKLQESGYVNASENDLLAIGENLKIGLVFHHNKKWENTQWNKVK